MASTTPMIAPAMMSNPISASRPECTGTIGPGWDRTP
jgi:hypothetical protein